MKYISIDIETTGLDAEKNQILSIGAVIEDTANVKPIEELPQLHIIIARKKIKGDIFAINMNAKLIQSINDWNLAKTDEDRLQIENSVNAVFVKSEKEAVVELYHFIAKNGYVNNINFSYIGDKPIKFIAAGKNFASFDKVFLEKLPIWNQVFSISSRIIDPAMLYINWNTDDAPPSLTECKLRANIKGEVTHNAVEDAIDVIKVLRKKYVNHY